MAKRDLNQRYPSDELALTTSQAQRRDGWISPEHQHKMAASREGTNPLRPYYIPPTIGISQEPNSTASSKGPTYASSARDIFSDIDYSDYVSESSQSTLDTIKELLDQALYKYMSVLLAQPFENAKTILQVRDQSAGDETITTSANDEARERRSQYQDSSYSVSSFLQILG